MEADLYFMMKGLLINNWWIKSTFQEVPLQTFMGAVQ